MTFKESGDIMKRLGLITAGILGIFWFIWIIAGTIMLLSGGLMFNEMQKNLMLGSMIILGICTIYWCFCYILILREQIRVLEHKCKNL